MYCTDITHLVCAHQFSNCYPLACTHLALRQCLMKRPPTDLTRLRETGSTLDMWLVPYKWPGGVCPSALAMRRCLQQWPHRGCNRDDWGSVLCHVFSQDRNRFFSQNP